MVTEVPGAAQSLVQPRLNTEWNFNFPTFPSNGEFELRNLPLTATLPLPVSLGFGLVFRNSSSVSSKYLLEFTGKDANSHFPNNSTCFKYLSLKPT